MRKLFSLFVALLATTVLLAQRFQVGDLYYNITSETTAEVTCSVDYDYFDYDYNYSYLTSVTIPSTVTYEDYPYIVTGISDKAFYNATSLTSITIPKTVTSIGRNAFENTGFYNNEANWDGDVLYINNCLVATKKPEWSDEEQTSVGGLSGAYTVKNTTRVIAACAFEYCYNLTSVTIPDNVTNIGGGLFYDCTSLTSVVLPKNITSLSAHSDQTMMMGYPAGFFEGCSSLTSFTIPSSVTSIGRNAFKWCHSLSSLTIPSSVTSIGDDAFAGSGLISATIPNTVKEVGGGLFGGCERLTSVVLYENITSLSSGGWEYTLGFFEGCSSLTSINIPNSVTEIRWEAFYGCTALKSLTIPNSVTEISNNAFTDCTSLEYLYIPNSVQYTEEDEYRVYYYDGYQSIRNCPNLKTLIVPADFFGVDGDEEDYQHVKSDVFPYLPERLESLTINDGTIHRLAWDFISRNYKTLKTIDLATTTDIAIAEEAFKNCYKLENLALPAQLEYIPYMAIAECVKLQSITIPATVTEIEDRAFENCRSIKSIIFGGAAPAQGPAHYAAASGSSLWRIGSWAFYNCHQLQNLTIPEGVTEVGDAAFYGCAYLEDMVLPSTIQEIGDNGFALCAKLQKIHVKATTPPTIQAKTFFDVNRQIPVYVPDNAVEAYKDDPYWREFDIQGESKAPSAVDNIPSAVTNTKKIIRNGQLLIIRDGKTYNTMGAEIR